MYQEGWAKIKRRRALAGPPSPGGGHRTYCLARLSSRRPPPSGSNRRSTPGAASFQRLARAAGRGETRNAPQIGKPRSHSPRPDPSVISFVRMASEQDVVNALRGIKDPESQKDIVALGLVRDVAVQGGEVSFTLAFAAQPPQTKVMIHSMASKLVGRLPGVSKVSAKMAGAAAAPAHQHGHAHGQAPSAAPAAPQRPADMIPEVKQTIAVSSGKGGVGKSTVAVNLALALHGTGASVGIIDADVYGPDLPLMLGTRGRPGMFDNRIIPVEAHGLKVMSIGLLVGDKEPLVWRGPMIHSFIQQMLRDVMWGPLDYLVFDMPPGTGDAQLSLSQVIPLSGVVMVTTPQDVALLDVRQAIAEVERLK